MQDMSLEEIKRAIPANIADDVDMASIGKVEDSISNDTGQTLESSLLKPCPFCGGKAFVQTSRLGDCDEEARVVCSSCHVCTTRQFQSWRITYTPTEKDITRIIAVAKAICSWNRRSQ